MQYFLTCWSYTARTAALRLHGTSGYILQAESCPGYMDRLSSRYPFLLKIEIILNTAILC